MSLQLLAALMTDVGVSSLDHVHGELVQLLEVVRAVRNLVWGVT